MVIMEHVQFDEMFDGKLDVLLRSGYRATGIVFVFDDRALSEVQISTRSARAFIELLST